MIRFFRWLASWFPRKHPLEWLGTVPAHKQSKYGSSRQGENPHE